MKKILLALAISLLVVSPAGALHGGAFPLPLSYTALAAIAENVETRTAICSAGSDDVVVAEFDVDGQHWLYASPRENSNAIFLEFVKGAADNGPVRVWILNDKDREALVVVGHIEDPINAVPEGPCSLLFPTTTKI